MSWETERQIQVAKTCRSCKDKTRVLTKSMRATVPGITVLKIYLVMAIITRTFTA
jgi:hypothetical protein